MAIGSRTGAWRDLFFGNWLSFLGNLLRSPRGVKVQLPQKRNDISSLPVQWSGYETAPAIPENCWLRLGGNQAHHSDGEGKTMSLKPFLLVRSCLI